MELDLADKRAFVSGATRGIGFAIARGLLDEGAEVVVNGRDERRVAEAVERLAAHHPDGRVSGIAADLADAGQVDDLLASLGPVDVLVHNVGVFGVAPFEALTDEDWLTSFQVNVMGAVRLSRRLLGPMLERGWGRVVFVNTESAVDVPADMLHYGVSKAGALALANGLAKRTRGTGVTVNTVLGGPTWSEGVAEAVAEVSRVQGVPVEDLRAAIVGPGHRSLLERFIEPVEIASLALYLASPRSSATNGAALRADGGALPTVL